jgi:DNA-binding transcriptional ArsR family regulator
MSPTQTQAPAENRVGVEPRLIKALGHPLRQRILIALNAKVASPSELSKGLGEPLGNVSYHVKILAECDSIELVKTAPVRGAVEHFYRATIRPYFDDENWASLPLSSRRDLLGDTLRSIWDHLGDAGKTGGLDDPETHVSWTTLELDEEAYRELTEHLRLALERALELQADSVNRRAKLPPEERGEHRRTELAIMHFNRFPAAAAE